MKDQKESEDSKKNFGTHKSDQPAKPEIKNTQAGKKTPEKSINPGQSYKDLLETPPKTKSDR